jgi:hypothetical protein
MLRAGRQPVNRAILAHAVDLKQHFFHAGVFGLIADGSQAMA